MSRLLWRVLVLINLQLAFGKENVQVLLDENKYGLWHRIVQIDTDVPANRLLERLVAPIIKAKSTRIRRLVVGSRRETLWGAFGKYMMYDAGQEVVLRQRLEASRTGQFLLEVICVNSDCIERRRDTSGIVTERVLSGSSPLRIEADGKTLSILYLEIQPRNRLVKLHGRIENGSLNDAPRLFGRILEQMRGFDVTLDARDDKWYFGCEGVPAEFLLWDEEYPADLTKYRSRPVVICGMWRVNQSRDCRQWYLEAPGKEHE